MPSVSHIILRRRQRQLTSRHSQAAGLGLSASMLFSLGAAVAVIILALAYTSLMHALPSLETLPVLLETPDGLLFQPTRLYDRSGAQVIWSLENPAAEGWQYLRLDPAHQPHLPAALISATLTVADPSFWDHIGFSLSGIGQNSHDTLAQRLVVDFLLWDEPPGWQRDLRERYLAAQVTAHFGREKVLEWYLNSAKYGPLIYGVDAAARVYLGKSAAELTLAEAALLAATADAPDLNPLDAPQLALERQKQLLWSMQVKGQISAAQAGQASQETIILRPALARPNQAEDFTRLALEYLSRQFPLSRLERGGLRITTTLDADLQAQAFCATQTYLARQTGAPEAAVDCPAARLLPTELAGQTQAVEALSGAALILDPTTGEVLALVGQSTDGLEPIQPPGRPAGSLVTPFIYLTSFTQQFSPASLLWDIPAQAPDPLSAVQNPDGLYRGALRLRLALANDYLVPAAQVLNQVGQERAWQTAIQFGLADLERPGGGSDRFSLLRGESVTLLQAGQAFGILSNQGILAGQTQTDLVDLSGAPSIGPVFVLQLKDEAGQVWWQKEAVHLKPVASPQLAYLVTHILSDEPARWASLGHPNLLEIGRPAAVKMGVTDSGQDAWTVGAVPQLVVGTWVGKPNGLSTPLSPNLAAALWRALIQYASRNLPAVPWKAPSGIQTVAVCDPSGLLPTLECATIVNEIFLTGAEPTRADNLFQTFAINRQTGRLATVFTPPELVEAHVFMVFPPQAETWARQSGLPAPPDTYDVIPAQAALASSEVNLTFPEMFDYVRGKITFRGSASGKGFSFFRLQAGAGLYPQHWLQLTNDTTREVVDGELGEWDTQGLDGVYAIQLMVVNEEQRVQIATIQVSVDNLAPEIELFSPGEGETVKAGGTPVVFQAEANDNLALAQVAYYLDDQLLVTMVDSPFMFAWQPTPGEHRLRAVASDQAGNSAETMLTFTVEK